VRARVRASKSLGRATHAVARRHTYADKQNFSAVATTTEGHTAVVSERGQLRLYDDISKRAKSLFEGSGGACVRAAQQAPWRADVFKYRHAAQTRSLRWMSATRAT
jgi:hypothetical protein